MRFAKHLHAIALLAALALAISPRTFAATLHRSPRTVLADTPMRITIGHLKPHQRVALQAVVQKGNAEWTAMAIYVADATG